MTIATESTSEAHGVPVDVGGELADSTNGVDNSTSAPAGRSSFARAGLEARDVVVAVLGGLFVVAFGPFFWASNWAPRAVLLLAALPFGMYELARLARTRDRTALVAVVLVGWAILTSLLSAAPWVSLLPTTGRNEGAWVMAGALGCWALARGLTSAGRAALGIALVAACAVNGVVGVLQVVLDIQTGPLGAIDRRATGFSTNPVYFGATTAGAVAWCAWRVGAEVSWKRVNLALVGVGCGAFLITMSGSRVALVAQLIFVALAILMRRTRRSLLLVPSVLIGVVLGTAVQRATTGTGTSATDRLGSGGFGPRMEIWKYGWKAFLDRPLTGYGLGRFRPATQRFFDADFVSVSQRDDLLEAWFESHNIIVQMTVAMGVVGMVLLVAFVTFSLRGARGPLVWAAGAITVTWLLQPANLVTFPLVALLLGASQPVLRNVAVERNRVVRPAIGSALLAMSILISGWVVMADFQNGHATSNPSVAASARAVQWSPWDPLVASDAAKMVFNPNGVDARAAEQVLAWSTRATEVEPDFPYWWMRLGIRQMVLADHDVARLSFEHALELQPYHPLSLQMLGVIAIEQGDDDLLRLVNERLQELGLPVEAGPTTAGT